MPAVAARTGQRSGGGDDAADRAADSGGKGEAGATVVPAVVFRCVLSAGSMAMPPPALSRVP